MLESIRDGVLGLATLAVFLTPLLGVAILRGWQWDWQCRWVLALLVLGLPLGALGHSFFGILLLGSVSLAVERQRRGLAAPF